MLLLLYNSLQDIWIYLCWLFKKILVNKEFLFIAPTIFLFIAVILWTTKVFLWIYWKMHFIKNYHLVQK